MLDEISKTIKAQLYERASSPLLTSFIFSWLIWNYRFILTLISSLPFHDKINYIDLAIFPSYFQILTQGIIFPLFTTAFIVFIYPIPAKFVYSYWRKRQRELKEIQQKIDDETPLTKEEARQIRQKAHKISIEYDKETSRMSDEISHLKRIIEGNKDSSSMPNHSPENTSPSPTKDDLDESQIDLLKTISLNPNCMQYKIIDSQQGKNKIRSKYDIGELIKRNYINSFNDDNGNETLTTTHEGLTYLIKNSHNTDNPSDRVV